MIASSQIARRLEATAPGIALTLRAHLERRWGEPELRLAAELSSGSRTAIDVGANRGVYSYWLARQARRCVAFEPNPDCAELLRKALGDRIDVREIALSDRTGRAELVIPVRDGKENSYRSSLHAETGAHDRQVEVPTARLDDLGLTVVDFMKVDVEGHEIETLAGAAETLDRDRPIVIIEAEERHRTGSVESVVTVFTERSYEGFFLFDGDVVPVDAFDPAIHQIEPTSLGARTASYANNFVFIPPERSAQLEILRSHA